MLGTFTIISVHVGAFNLGQPTKSNEHSADILRQTCPLDDQSHSMPRRQAFSRSLQETARLLSFGVIAMAPSPVAAKDIDTMLRDVDQSIAQLQNVPSLIESEKWDAVRNILITPPISNFRKATIWQEFADSVEGSGGDEFEVLDMKDVLQGHLQSLDMAVYNNVFNPIKTQGETGATRELVRSYYEDPVREYKATKAALEKLREIGKPN